MQCSLDTNYPHVKSVARRCAPMASSPRILQQTDRHRPDAEAMQKALSQFIVAPRAQASRRCETQAPLPFRSLDPFRALREPDPRRRDEKRPFPLRTKNWQQTQNNRLTGKAPYRFE